MWLRYFILPCAVGEESKPKIFSQTFCFKMYDSNFIEAFVQIWMFYEPVDGREGGELKKIVIIHQIQMLLKEKCNTFLNVYHKHTCQWPFTLSSSPILISSKFKSPLFEAKLVIFIFTLQGKLKLYWAMKLSKIRWVVRVEAFEPDLTN